MCDLRFASEDSTWGFPPPPRCGLCSPECWHAAGSGRTSLYARDPVYRPTLQRDEALRLGLLPWGGIAPYVQDYAAMIGANAPLTIRAAKLASTELLKTDTERDLTVVQHAVEACFDSSDYHEGRTAFMEKRPPVFTGR